MQFLNYNKLQSTGNGALSLPGTPLTPRFRSLVPGPYALGMQHPDIQSLIYNILYPGTQAYNSNALSVRGLGGGTGQTADAGRGNWGRPSQSPPEFLKMFFRALVLQKIFPNLFFSVSTDMARTFPNNVSMHKVCTPSQDGSTGVHTRVCLN